MKRHPMLRFVEEPGDNGGGNPADPPKGERDGDKQITMTSKQLAERLERAKPADYDDLKAKASKLDELEQANKSEIDKVLDRVTKAEAEVAKVPSKLADALRTHLVALHQISNEDAELFLTANDPELLIKQVERLTGHQADRKKRNNYVAREGDNPTRGSGDDGMRDFARNLFGSAAD